MSVQRSILHMDLDTFFVSCERLLDSRLVGQPILIGGTGDRGVVASCSYEARQFGIHSAMPMKMARERCPEAIVIKGNASTYTKHSQQVIEIIKESVPVYEVASIDEFYMDLSGMDKFFGCLKYSTELRQRIMRETGLPISFGLSVNKTVSKIATGEAKPNNQRLIDFGTEKSFLAPLSVQKIPMVGMETYKILRQMGIVDIGTIQQMPIQMMENALGENGKSIWRKAQGIDFSPVIQYQERKSISTERTFERDTTNARVVKAILFAMAEDLAFQLRRADKLTGCISVRIRYSDFQTTSLQHRVHFTAADHEILPLVMDLFDKLYKRRQLIRLIGVRFSELVGGHHQLSLFESSEKYGSLYQAMDRIRDKYGNRSIVRAVGMEAKTIGRSNPFTGGAPPLLPNRKQ